jgi:hypothetical protein
MKAIALLILASSFFVTAGAQPNPDTLWTRTYGGDSNDYWAKSVLQTTDGGYLVAGSTTSFGAGERDFYLIKTDSQGDTIWTRTYGGSGDDQVGSAIQTADGGYVVTGFTMSFSATWEDVYLVKTDSQGDTIWTNTVDAGHEEYANSIQQLEDGGYIIAGQCVGHNGFPDFYLVRTDSVGDTLWTRAYGRNHWDGANSVAQTSDGGFIMAGYSYEDITNEIEEFCLMKTNAQGDTLWTRIYGEFGGAAESVQQTADGGYIAAGCRWTSGNFYVVKTNDEGDTLWTRTYGNGIAHSVLQTSDGGYIVAGSLWGDADNSTFYLVRTDSQGDTLWTRTYGGVDHEVAYSVQQTSDGGYIIAGDIGSYPEGNSDFYLVKTGPDLQGIEPIEVSIPEQYILYPNFPNPFNATTQLVYEMPKAGQVSLSIYNLLGEEVVSLVDGVQAAGRQTVAFDGAGLASGVYLSRLQAGGFVQARKMVLLK